MAEINSRSHLIPVRVIEVKNGGEFVSMPLVQGFQEDAYSVFLADLNNHMNESKNSKIFLSYQQCRIGELVAVYCKVQEDDEERLWYRGRVLSKFKNVNGITIKVLLVDCGSTVLVPGTLMRKLETKFQDFPMQMMTCCFYGLKPLTYIATTDSLVSKHVGNKWDSSAKIRIQELLTNAASRVYIHMIDKRGFFHVTLYATKVDHNGRHSDTNINELLVEENYAVVEKPVEANGMSLDDDADSTMSSSSFQDAEDDLNDLTPSELEKLKERKKIEEQRFASGINLRMDEHRDVFGLPPLEDGETDADSKQSKSSVVKMWPANCEDGIDLVDEQPCASSETLCSNRKESTRKFVNLLKTVDPQLPVSQDAAHHSQTYKRDKTAVDTPALQGGKASSTPGTFGDKNIWSLVKGQGNKAQSSSLSESENEVGGEIPRDSIACEASSKKSYADYEKMASDEKAKEKKVDVIRRRYVKECWKQQHKDRSDENSFQTVNSTWQLLKDLGVGNAMKAKWQSQNHSLDSGIEVTPNTGKDVLLSGERHPKCPLSLEELNVPEDMKYSIRNDSTEKLITKATSLQSYLWPAILRGRHVVGIDGAGSGKKLGYILPLLKQIVDMDSLYRSLPKGNGPILLILTTDWSEAWKISKTCEKLLYYYRTTHRCKILYGGRGNVQEEMVSLINGCDVLVSTIPSLLGMIDKHCTNLERLCHLVFDRAHILVENFSEEIKALMRAYAESLTSTLTLNLPQQIIALSSEWSRGLESLLYAYFDNPLIIIANTLEASVFKKVKQCVEICASRERMDHVLNILKGDSVDDNVVIFVNSAQAADSLRSLLESQCIGVLKATEFMPPTELKDLEANWNYVVESRKPGDFVLVMTDRVSSRISIKNATCIINYEFPKNKSDFGKRLNCLLGAMKDKTEKSKDTKSIVFITEEYENVVPSFTKLLRRARQHVPPMLDAIANKVNQLKEERAKNFGICDDLKYFGACRDVQKCSQRHTVFADSDEPKNIPKCGVVKVQILDVVSANVYWGKIVDHKLPRGAVESKTYDTKAYFKLAYDMQIFYAIPSNRIKHGLSPEGILKDDVCVIHTEDGFQRVRVESIERRDTQTAIATEVNVFGLDSGVLKSVSVTELYVLPEDKCFSLENVPQQAIELIVCGVKPVDKSFSWTVEACNRICRLISGETFEGKIALGLRNTLWLDPLVKKTKYDELNANITTLHVGAYLLDCGFAEKTKSHVKNLRNLCKDCLPSVVNAAEVAAEAAPKEISSARVKRLLETEEMPETDYQDVYVSAVENPALFFVQLWKKVDKLEKLEGKIESVMKVLPKHEEPDINEIGHGTICLAKFTLDDKWYRARVLEVNQEQGFHVYYVDHGELEWVQDDRIWKAWPEVLELPCQAIECSLVHVSPPQGQDWSNEDGDCFWNLCEDKLLVAMVKSRVESDYAGAYKYTIELYDTTGTSTINMSHELVFLGCARGSQDCIQEIFPDALQYPESREVTNAVDCVPDLCLQIFSCKVASEQIELVRKLHGIVDNAIGSELTIHAATKSIVKLMALCRSKEVSGILLDVITCLMQKNGSLSNDILREGGLRTLCNLLTQESQCSSSIKVISALNYFTKDSRNKQALSGCNCIASVCDVLKENSENEAACLCLEFLCSVCEGNDSNCEGVFESDGISRIVYLTNSSSDVKVLELCSKALYILAQSFRIRERLRETGVIDAIGKLLSKKNTKAVLLNCLGTLKFAVNNNQAHREYIRKAGIIPAIERILYRPMAEGLEVKAICKHLLAKFKINTELTGSGQQTIQLPKMEPDIEPPPLLSFEELPCVSPKTLWSQREGYVTLAIQLRGVQNETVVIGERQVFFRCLTDEFNYQLELDLFDDIIPESSNWKVHGGEVVIHLTKMEKVEWPRLLSSKIKLRANFSMEARLPDPNKGHLPCKSFLWGPRSIQVSPPFLYVDFDRWNLEVEDDDVRNPKLPPRSTSIGSANRLAYGAPDRRYGNSDSSDEDSSSDFYDEFDPIT